MKLPFLFGAVAIFVLFGNAPSTADANACTLLTPAQILTATGVVVSAGKNLGGSYICGWKASNASKNIVVYFEDASHRTLISGSSPFMRNVQKTPVSGLGDGAVYISNAGMFGTGLAVKKGQHVFQVRAPGFPADQGKDIEMKLARVILSHM